MTGPRMTPTNDAPVTVERYTVSKQADNSVASRWCIRDGAEGGRYVAGGITGRASASVIAHEMNRLAALASAPAAEIVGKDQADRDRRMYEQGRRDERAGEPEAFI